MTKTQKWVVKYLRGRGWCSPTQIGNAYGDSKHGNNSFHCYHSAWASPRCKALVEAGVLERNEKGHYRLASAYQIVLSEEYKRADFEAQDQVSRE